MNKEFLERMEKQLGKDKFKAYLISLNEKDKHGFSLNKDRLKLSSIDLDYIVDIFSANVLFENDHFAYLTYDKEALEKKNIYPGKHPLYHAGLFYIQEPSAAKVLCDINFLESDKVLDLCASPGGKSCMALYNVKESAGGFVLANEIKSDRARILSSNIERMGFVNSIVTCETSKKLTTYFNDYFDKVIVDTPCSGEGMFRKSEEAVKQWSVDLVKSCSKLQKELLEDAYKMLRPGGVLIYSTCTFSREEDEENVQYILDSHKDLLLIHMEKMYPYEGIGEGQFFSYLKKGEDDIVTTPGMPDIKKLKGLNILRYNFKMEDEINGRKIPSHAITHIDGENLIENVIDLDDKEIINYLHGEVIRKETSISGFCKITYKNLGVGLAKVSDKVIKNHYPKGLRLLY